MIKFSPQNLLNFIVKFGSKVAFKSYILVIHLFLNKQYAKLQQILPIISTCKF
jgi:hypothetical protein